MDKFTEEIKKLSDNVYKPDINTESKSINSHAIESLFEYAEKGVTTLKSNGITSINLHKLPVDLVPLFFHFDSGGEGFVISTAKRFAFFMQSSDKKIFIYGKVKKFGIQGPGNDKMQQLFNIDFTENNGSVAYYDSTNKELKADEIVLLALNWSLN